MAVQDTVNNNFYLQIFCLVCPLLLLTLVCKYLIGKYNLIRKEVVLLTRYPVPGKAKTRLIPSIGIHGAARVQVLMVEHHDLKPT